MPLVVCTDVQRHMHAMKLDLGSVIVFKNKLFIVRLCIYVCVCALCVRCVCVCVCVCVSCATI